MRVPAKRHTVPADRDIGMVVGALGLRGDAIDEVDRRGEVPASELPLERTVDLGPALRALVHLRRVRRHVANLRSAARRCAGPRYGCHAMNVDDEKRLAAEAAAELVEDGMTVGLGTGSTVAFLLPALARRGLSLRCVATSPRTEDQATSLGLIVEPFTGLDALARLDIAIDGADQVAPDRWLVKGGGGAHLRERLVAAAADRFVVIASSDKLVERIRAPIPLELHPFGLAATLRRLDLATLREAAPTPDGGVLADYYGDVEDPGELAAALAGTPGVADHGLFEPLLVAEVIVGRDGGTERLTPS
jgi:ribose 5-phosphate isomerase A